jgi:hypothetical protein
MLGDVERIDPDGIRENGLLDRVANDDVAAEFSTRLVHTDGNERIQSELNVLGSHLCLLSPCMRSRFMDRPRSCFRTDHHVYRISCYQRLSARRAYDGLVGDIAGHHDEAENAPGCADALADDLGWGLGMIFRAYVEAAHAAVADLPGGPRGYQVLSAAAQGTVNSQLALAQHLGVDRTVMTYLLDDLEAACLIERRPDPADRPAESWPPKRATDSSPASMTASRPRRPTCWRRLAPRHATRSVLRSGC